MIQCPNCREMIADDSVFCDQCGKELMWCPVCKRPKRGTQCPVCGNDLVPGRKNVIPGEASVSPSTLVGAGWSLTLREGPFGRRGGIWPELGSCQYVSGSHGSIGKSANGWTITDNGSTNGTFVNGARLPGGVATALKIGDKVKIATLEFTVE